MPKSAAKKRTSVPAPHKVVSHEACLKARIDFLTKEKEFTKLRDKLSQQRRALPWEKVEKNYTFDGPNGKQTLVQLFDGRSQLIVFHLMFAPDWKAACKSCSFGADSYERNVIHLKHRDATFVAVSRAPVSKLEAFKKRMGWTFPWFSSGNSDFNYDYGVSFKPEEDAHGKSFYNYKRGKVGGTDRTGVSIFYKDESGQIFHTYSCYERGTEITNSAYQTLDWLPKGRDEDNLPFTMSWVRHRDKYED